MPTDNVVRLQQRWVEPDLERAVLGSIAVSGEAWDAAQEFLSERVFTGASRPGIYSTIAEFYRERIPFDALGLQVAIGGQRALAEAGGATELVECLSAASYVSTLARHYAKQIQNLWALREARRVVGEFLDHGRVEDANGAIERLQKSLVGIEVGRGSAVESIADVMIEMQRELEEEHERKPGTEAISTGYGSIDRAIGGFEPGIMQVYCARPGGGKSSLATGFSCSLGSRGVPAGVFWLEDSKRMFALRVAASEARIPTRMMRHGTLMRAPYWDRLAEAVKTVSRWPLYIEPTKGIDGREVARRIRKMHREKGIRVALIDHAGEMGVDGPGDRVDLKVGDGVRAVRDECGNLGITPVFLHQLSQKAEQEGSPRLGWIFNTDIIGQAGRVVGFLSRSKQDESKVWITYVKATYAPPHTKIELGWDPETMRIHEVGEAQQSFA